MTSMLNIILLDFNVAPSDDIFISTYYFNKLICKPKNYFYFQVIHPNY